MNKGGEHNSKRRDLNDMIMTGLNVFWKTKKVINRLVHAGFGND
jgi:hypothetical protein